MPRRRALTVLLVVGALLLSSVAGVALAKTFTCKPGSTEQNPCNGTKKRDNITGTSGDDYILDKRGNDNIHGGPGNDHIDGGPGDDVIGDLNGPAYGNPPDADVVFDGPGDDVIDLQDGDGNDVLCTTDGDVLTHSDVGDQVIDDAELCALL